jgi:hypothetical protein
LWYLWIYTYSSTEMVSGSSSLGHSSDSRQQQSNNSDRLVINQPH